MEFLAPNHLVNLQEEVGTAPAPPELYREQFSSLILLLRAAAVS